MPAATLNRFGAGKVFYIGYLSDSVFYEALARMVSTMAGIDPILETPDGVEVVERWQNDKRLLFVLNHSGDEKTFNLDKPYINLLNTSNRLLSNVTMAPSDVLLLIEEQNQLL